MDIIIATTINAKSIANSTDIILVSGHFVPMLMHNIPCRMMTNVNVHVDVI